MSCLYTELWTVLNKTYTVEFVLVTEGVLAMFTGYAKFVEGSYNTLVLWQVLYPIGWLNLYGLTECIINEWMNEYFNPQLFEQSNVLILQYTVVYIFLTFSSSNLSVCVLLMFPSST